MAIATQKPQLVVRDGRPRAVILGLKAYERLLEAAEDREDLRELRRIKKGRASFRALRDYLKRV